MKKFILICLMTTMTQSCSSESHSNAINSIDTQTLYESFDLVETFDQIKDWDGSARTGYNYGVSFAPKQSDGTDSKWIYFTNDRVTIELTESSDYFMVDDMIIGKSSGATGKVEKIIVEDGKKYLQLTAPTSGNFIVGEMIRNQMNVTARFNGYPKWIANHGSDFVWGGNGKSLRINYYDFSGGIAGFGPSRLGLFLGDGVTGKSGYKKIHVFMMVKFHPGFFKRNPDGTFQWVGTLKFFELCSGFTAPDYWGTTAEHSRTTGRPQVTTEYGLNHTVFNIKGGGTSTGNRLFFEDSTVVANFVHNSWDYSRPSYSPLNLTNGFTTDIDSYYSSSDWFGVEVAADIGTPNKANGAIDLWIYDKNGVEKGHFTATDQNRLVQFDHYYNKVTLGGNRLCNGYGTCPDGQDNRWYADDVIIDSERIGPKYFKIKFRQ